MGYGFAPIEVVLLHHPIIVGCAPRGKWEEPTVWFQNVLNQVIETNPPYSLSSFLSASILFPSMKPTVFSTMAELRKPSLSPNPNPHPISPSKPMMAMANLRSPAINSSSPKTFIPNPHPTTPKKNKKKEQKRRRRRPELLAVGTL